jgi:fibronectin type 3 domain-containing protein
MVYALGFTCAKGVGAQEVAAIAAGGPAESNTSGGDNSFVADEDFVGGGDNAPVTASISLTQPGVNAAPMAVYQHGRAGVSTYTIPGLTGGSRYSVLLHFAETYFSAAGGREFNVAINGTTVLTNLDVYATVGKNAALLETFTATANSSGQIVIAFTVGAKDQPLIMGIEIRGASGAECTAVPSAPTGVMTSGATSNSLIANWSAVTAPANCSISSYSVYRSTTNGFTPSANTLVSSGGTGTSYTNTGLATSTTYYFVIEALDAGGTSASSAQASGTTSAASCSAVPAAPAGLTATATTSSAISLSWTAVTPPGDCTISSYSVYGGTTANPTTLIASVATGTSYSNTGLAASATYYYVVKAVDADGASAASTQAQATTQAAGNGTEIVAIAAGGPAESDSGGGDFSFVADEDFAGGGDNSPVTATIALSQPGANSAPMAVYQYGRAGVSTYTIPGLTAGSSYSVLLHFAETYFSAAGGREFNVAINGTTVLTNLDIYASVGKNAALLETFTATANSSGQIVIAFTVGAANQPVVMGIEIRGASGTSCSAVPSAPTGLVATASSSSVIGLSWAAVTPPANCTIGSYNVYGGTTPSPTTLIAGGVTGTTYSTTGLAASTTYYYVVKAVDADGTSAASAQAAATTQSGAACTTVPSAPTGLTATAASSSNISLNWTAVTPPANCSISSYSVYGGTTASPTTLIAGGVTGTSYSNTGLAASTTYYYVVKVVDGDGISAASAQAQATTPASSAPAPATGLTAVGSSSQQIDLRWVASTTLAPNAAPVNYLVYRSTTSPFTPSASNLMGTTIGITNYLDGNYPATLSPPAGPGVQSSTTYYYQVVASTPSGTSAAALASATTLPATASIAAPAALTGLTAIAENANEIDLMWNSTNSEVGTLATEYYIYRSATAPFTPSASNEIGSTKSNWFQDALGTASTQYYYQVLASNSLGTSPSSATVTATTPGLNPNLWGGAPFWDASNMPALPAGDTVMMKFLNRTNGKYTNDQIIWTATINGVASQYTFAEQPTFAMPPNSSGRMYFFLNDPTLAEDNTDYWDFIEFTAGPTSINMDTTRVDAFGVKIAFNLTCGDGTKVALGENEQTFTEDRSVTFQRYLNAVPSTSGGDFQSAEIYAPYRIIEPGGAGFNAGGADQDYYQTYISDIWSFNGITIPLAGPNGSDLGANPDLSAAIFRHTAPISGTPEFNAAGDLTNQGMWGNPAGFYQQEPFDHYAQWIEAQAINMQQYAFPYNDAGGYSSDIGCSNPKTLLVVVGW